MGCLSGSFKELLAAHGENFDGSFLVLVWTQFVFSNVFDWMSTDEPTGTSKE